MGTSPRTGLVTQPTQLDFLNQSQLVLYRLLFTSYRFFFTGHWHPETLEPRVKAPGHWNLGTLEPRVKAPGHWNLGTIEPRVKAPGHWNLGTLVFQETGPSRYGHGQALHSTECTCYGRLPGRPS